MHDHPANFLSSKPNQTGVTREQYKDATFEAFPEGKAGTVSAFVRRCEDLGQCAGNPDGATLSANRDCSLSASRIDSASWQMQAIVEPSRRWMSLRRVPKT